MRHTSCKDVLAAVIVATYSLHLFPVEVKGEKPPPTHVVMWLQTLQWIDQKHRPVQVLRHVQKTWIVSSPNQLSTIQELCAPCHQALLAADASCKFVSGKLDQISARKTIFPSSGIGEASAIALARIARAWKRPLCPCR